MSPAAAGSTVPTKTVIVRGTSTESPAAIGTAVARLGGHVSRTIAILHGVVAEIPAGGIAALRRVPGVAAVTPDAQLALDSIGGYDPTSDAGSLYSAEQATGTQAAWQQGATGQGVGVALIDTGVTPVLGLSGAGQVINGVDLSFDSQTPTLTKLDAFGHGTHMAGIIAGNDGTVGGRAYAGNSGQFTGVAPDSHVVNVKVGDHNGVVDVSQVLAGIDWVVLHRNDNNANIRVINLSFGSNSSQPYTLDPLAFAAEAAWHSGLVVVASAGNGGQQSNGLNDPAYDPYLIAVGSTDTQGTVSPSDDTVASFSNSGNGVRNPDVVAPGIHIASLRVPGSVVDQKFGSTATVSSNARFLRGSGTSQAAAVVSGAAADVLSAHPGYTPDQVKYALTTTASSLGAPSTQQGSGEFNLAAALSPIPPASQVAQNHVPSTGTGTLEAARGGIHVSSAGVPLTGEQDMFGNAFNSAAVAAGEAAAAVRAASLLNGINVQGTSWSGTSWSGTSWSGTSWSGTSWSGTSWSGTSWSGTSWSGTSWSGTSWSGTSWSDVAWADSGWTGSFWA